MEKLFDLMVTGFKYQTLCSQQPQEILQVIRLLHNPYSHFTPGHAHQLLSSKMHLLAHCDLLLHVSKLCCGISHQCNPAAHCMLQVTLLHLHTVKKFLTESQVKHAVDVVEARVLSLYEKLTIGQWRLVRQTLCSFFQDRRIKVLLRFTVFNRQIKNHDTAIFLQHDCTHRQSLPVCMCSMSCM